MRQSIAIAQHSLGGQEPTKSTYLLCLGVIFLSDQVRLYSIITLADVLLALMLMLSLPFQIRRLEIKSPFFLWIMATLASLGLGLPWYEEPFAEESILFTFVILIQGAKAWLVYSAIPKALERLGRVQPSISIGMLAIIFVLIIGQQLIALSAGEGSYSGSGRFQGTMETSSGLFGFAIFGIGLSLSLIGLHVKGGFLIYKLVFTGACAACIWLAFASGSRSVFLYLPLVAVAAVCFGSLGSWRPFATLVVLALAWWLSFGSGTLELALARSESFFGYFGGGFSADHVDAPRSVAFERTIIHWMDDPYLIGHGIDSSVLISNYGYRIHNAFLCLWYEAGVLSSVALVTVFLIAAWQVFKEFRNGDREISFFLAMVGLAIFILFLKTPMYCQRFTFFLWLICVFHSTSIAVSLRSAQGRNA